MQLLLKQFRFRISSLITSKKQCTFCSEKTKDSNVQTRSFNKNAVHDFSKIAFEPQQNLLFVEGKCLLYKYNKTIMASILHNSVYWIPIIAISGFIYANPFADFFPASIPIAIFCEIVLIKLWLNKIKWNQNTVSQIYLLDNGEATEIWFANKLKRQLFGEQVKKIYYNSVFVNPNYESQQILLVNKDNRVFPTSEQQAAKQHQGYAWIKHFSNGQNFLVIPKRPNFSNMKVLIQIFKGKIIKRKYLKN